MTSMEQIEYMQREARKMGIKWSEWRERFGHTLPKPTPTPRKEIDWWEGTNRKPPSIRKEREIVCETCGKPFISKSPTARNCEECRRARQLEKMREWREQKKKQKPSVYYKNCLDCGEVFASESGKARYCPACAKERRKQQTKESWKRHRDKKKAEKANAKIQE